MGKIKSRKGIGRHSHIRDSSSPRLADRSVSGRNESTHTVGAPSVLRVVPTGDTPDSVGDAHEQLTRRLARLGWALAQFPQWRLEAYLDVEFSEDDLEAFADAMLSVSGDSPAASLEDSDVRVEFVGQSQGDA